MAAPTSQCRRCNSRLALERRKCPRCGAVVPEDTLGAGAEHSRWMARLAGMVISLFVVAIGILWATTERLPADVVGMASDPLAARRQTGQPPSVDDPPNQRAPMQPPVALSDAFSSAAASHRAGEDDEELTVLTDAVNRDPRDAEARSRLGQLLVSRDRVEDALTHLERAGELEPAHGVHAADLARAFARLRRWSESAEAYRHAHRLLPADPVTAFEFGLSLHKSGNDAGAVDAYTRAIQLSPSDAALRLALAISYERLKKRAEAAAAYADYLRLAPADPDAERVRTKIAQLETS